MLCNSATIVRTFPIISHVFATLPETFLKSLHPSRGGAKTGHERAAEIEPSFFRVSESILINLLLLVC